MQQPRDFSMAGAADLGARQAAAKRSEQAAQPGAGGAASSFVFEVTDATFNTDVVARSQSAPVIVDLWAEWCEPCKQLGPVLERLAGEAAGDWLLAKVDVDANPQLAAALQVQSIPMVVAVIGGQLVDGFLGALPEAQVRQWINQVLQVADQLGMPARVRAEAPVSDGAEAGRGGLWPARSRLGRRARRAARPFRRSWRHGPGRTGWSARPRRTPRRPAVRDRAERHGRRRSGDGRHGAGAGARRYARAPGRDGLAGAGGPAAAGELLRSGQGAPGGGRAPGRPGCPGSRPRTWSSRTDRSTPASTGCLASSSAQPATTGTR